MSTPRYKWWSYVQWMIRLYPGRMAELRRIQSAHITPQYGTPARTSSSDIPRSTERYAIASLGPVIDRETRAVKLAIDQTKAKKNGNDIIKFIDLVYWKRTHDISGACIACYVSDATGRRWNGEFIRSVARNFGILD